MTGEQREQLRPLLDAYARAVDPRLRVVTETWTTWDDGQPEEEIRLRLAIEDIVIDLGQAEVDLLGMRLRRHLAVKLNELEDEVAASSLSSDFAPSCLRAVYLRTMTVGMIRILDEVSEGAWTDEP